MPLETFAIHPGYVDRLRRQPITVRERSEKPTAYVVNAAGDRLAVGSRDAGRQSKAVAVLPLWGVLSQFQNWYSDTSTEQFVSDFRKLDAAPNVGTIIVLTNSPGGTVSGTLEASDAIYAARKRNQTRIIQAISSLSASAAEWVGTSCHERIIQPSGECGSIGVLSMYFDESRALEQIGVSVTVERTPERKARFSGVEPMTDDMRLSMRARNQAAYSAFVAAVSRNRNVTTSTVIERYGNGETMTAREALSAGFVDSIATVDEVISDAVAGRSPRARRSTSASSDHQARLRRLALLEVE